MIATQKRRDPDLDHGAVQMTGNVNSLPHQSGIVNPKRAERLARRLRRTEARLIRLACERARLSEVLAGMAEGVAA
ncbi:hypothetical protein [Desulfolutivibrio sulfoxidireducens]|uniref:hypothetical protein n=1 Tax=Desulfolutivibrio sulfoxidireducens TaxID=2773299 RepID=UPI00159DD252|nr:hypothetical protein [Desulfolutivibrio sulfoxidireducens]QLA21250.1 hypothetical protein GD604_16725 [Desulfolutivibrio sulfoxidireducens]